MKHKWWIVFGVALAGALGGSYAWLHRPLSVTAAHPTRGPAVDAIYAAGSIEPTVVQPIASKITGRLVSLLVDEGQTVRKGQVLARLDDTDLSSTVDEALARLKLAQTQHKRTQDLVKQQFLAPVELDRAQADLDAAQATVKRAQALRDVLTLVAPADGTIIKRDAEIGQVVTAGQTIMTMSCCAPLRATVDVDEEDITRVYRGQTVVLRADALSGQQLQGVVADITPKGDPVSRSYRVRIKLASTKSLMAGMTVEANLVVTQRDHALLVPTTAVQKDSVWVVNHGKAHWQPIKAGISGTTKVEVLEGLSDASEVVTTPPANLSEGRAVRTMSPRP